MKKAPRGAFFSRVQREIRRTAPERAPPRRYLSPFRHAGLPPYRLSPRERIFQKIHKKVFIFEKKNGILIL